MHGNTIDFYIGRDEIADHEVIRRGLEDVTAHNYNAVLIFYCDAVVVPKHSREFKDAMAFTVEVGHSLGLKVSMHALMIWDPEFVLPHPGGYCRVVKEVVLQPGGGEARCHYPPQTRFDSIETAFECPAPDPQTWYRVALDEAIELEIETCITGDRKGFTSRNKEVVLRSRDPERRFIVYPEFRTNYPDMADPAMKQYISQRLEHWRDVPLDGLAWDEPGFPLRRRARDELLVSPGIRDRFSQSYGELLDDQLPLYVHDRADGQHVPMRLAYFEALRSALFDQQMHFKNECKRLFGPDTQLGIHHTWAETESVDLFGGQIDYPYLRNTLTSGFTDAVFFFGTVSTTYSATLASSLARGSDTDEAYCNLWCFRPRRESIDWHTRLLLLFNVNWISIGYGEDSAVHFPMHHTWDFHGETAKRHKEVLAALYGAKRQVDVGLVHTWRALAADPGPTIDLHRIGMAYCASHALRHGIGLEILGEHELAEARIDGQHLIVGDCRLRSLIVPWPDAMSEPAWDVVRRFIEVGGTCVFYGPPPRHDSVGKSRFEMFQKVLGVSRIDTNLIKMIDFENHRLDSSWGEKLTPETGQVEDKMITRARERTGTDPLLIPSYRIDPKSAETWVTHNEDVIGVASKTGNVLYFSFEMPLYVGCMNKVFQRIGIEVAARMSSPCLMQSYRCDDGSTVYVLIPRDKERLLEGVFSIDGKETPVSPCRLALIRVNQNGFDVKLY